MAISTEEIIIDLKLNADSSTKSLNQLEEELASLKDALKNVATGSAEFKKLQAEVVRADSRMRDLNKSIEGLDTEAIAGEIGKLGGGISAAFVGVSAVIGNANEDFEKFTKNIVTGIAVTNGIKGVTEAWTAATKLARVAQIALNAAMKANPIGVVITAVAALTGAIYLLTKAFEDTSTEQENNIKLLKLNSEEYKAFITEVKSANDALLASKLSYAVAIDSAEAMTLTIDSITNAEDEQIKKLEETSKARKKQLQTDLANIKGFGQEAFNKRLKLSAQFDAEEKVSNDAKIASATTTSFKLATIQATLNKDLKAKDAERIKAFAALQDKIIKLIRDANNRILGLELQTYTVLNANRSGLADYEIELLNRNLELKKKMMQESNRDNIDSLKRELSDLSVNNAEKQRILENSLQIAQKSRNDALAKNQADNAEALKNGTRSQEEYDFINQDLSAKARQKDLQATEKFEADKAAITNNSIANQRAINLQIKTLQTSLNKEIINEEKLVASQILILKKEFNKQIFNDTIAVNERLQVLNLELILKQTANQSEASMIEIKLLRTKFDNIIDLEEELALRRSSIQFFQEERAKEAIVDKLKLIQNASAEELQLITTLEKEIGDITTLQVEELFRIRREFADKRIELEKEILRSQISSLQANLDRELRLYEGNNERVFELTKRRLESEKTLELMAAEEKYKADLLLVVNNNDKKLELTQEYENTKSLIEDDFRQKKLKAEIEGYKKVAQLGAQIFGELQQIMLNQTTATIDKELKMKTDALDAEAIALDGAVEAGLETEESKNDKLRAIDLKREKAERKAAYDKAKAEKQAALVQAAIQTALAILEASPVIPLMITAGVLGAAQAAVIASTPLPQLRRGGRINGPKHEQGGVPLYKDGSQIAEVEGGELIMTSGVSQSPVLLKAASQLNQLAGGVSFTNQSIGSTGSASMPMSVATIDESSLARVMQSVSSIPVTNVATSTDKIARKVKNIETKSRF